MPDIPDYAKRLIIEQDELQERLGKLGTFVDVQNTAYRDLEPRDKELLNGQLKAMHEYNTILKERIELAGGGKIA